jgi:hypothetical protein
MKATLADVDFGFVDHFGYDSKAFFARHHFFLVFHNNVYFYISVIMNVNMSQI